MAVAGIHFALSKETIGPAAQILIDVISHHVNRGSSPSQAAETVRAALNGSINSVAKDQLTDQRMSSATVFGGTGFVGGRVVRHLRESSTRVRIGSQRASGPLALSAPCSMSRSWILRGCAPRWPACSPFCRLPVKAFFDIGGAGHSSDAMAIWIAQFVGREIRLLDYIEGVGQPLAYYAHELRRRGWKDAIVCLPHDGVATNNITGKRYIDHWTEAGFECGTPIKNTGAGAAMMRIEAARRVFPRCWFNGSTTEAGRDALGYYHERQDEKRTHDWSSHAADAFGYMAIAYEEPPVKSAIRRPAPPRMGTHWSD
jgi:hypothetical protein